MIAINIIISMYCYSGVIDVKIDDTTLSVRVKNALKNINLIFVDDLLKLNNSQLYKIKNLGENSIDEIIKFKNIFENEDFESQNKNSFDLPTILEENPNQKIGEIITRIYSNIARIEFIDAGRLKKYKTIENVTKRTTNIIEENLLNEIDFLMEHSLSDINSLPRLGEKSYHEIFEFLIRNIVVIENDKKMYGFFESVMGYLMVQKLYNYFEEDSLRELYNKIYEICLQGNFSREYTWDDLNYDFSTILKEKNIMNQLFENSILKELIIVNILKGSNIPLNVASIKNKLPLNLNTINVADIVNDLRKQDKVFFVEHGFKYKEQGIVVYLDRNFPEKKKKPMMLKLQGYTLEEIGYEMGYTRERARQIISKLILKIPLRIYEERYSAYFTRYNFNKNQFLQIFLVEEIEYQYLQMRYEKGESSFEDMIDDESVDKEIKVRLRKVIDEGYIVIENDRIRETKTDIIKYLVKEYCYDPMSVHEFTKIYYKFLEEYNLKIDKLSIDKRYIEGRIADSDFAISLIGRKFRYYKFDDYDWISFYEELSIGNYNNKEISTLKLFKDTPFLMEVYNINNEYELHNILKKTQQYCDLKLIFKRMPTLKIGEADRDEQVLNIFLTHVPIEASKLGEIYEDEYGVKKSTAMANHFKCINNHLYNGTYIYESEDVENDDLNILKQLLIKDEFHFIEDIKMKLKEEEVDYSTINQMMTPIILEKMGYATYSTYILSKTYQTMSEFIERNIFNKDIVNINNIKPEFINLSTVQSKIRDYNSNLEYLEFDDNHYISIEKLAALDLNKDYLKKIIAEIYNVMNEEVFSIKMVKNYIENTKIEEFGFSDKFYVSLLKSHNKIYTLKVGRSYLFSKNNSDLRIVRLIQDIMNVRKSIDIYQLIDYLDETHGLQFEKSTIIETTKDSGMYYDSIMEKLYLDNEYYYEEFDF